MSPDLLRQRRNLVVISAVLLIFDFAQVKISKVSVLGTELLVGNPQTLMVCAWLLWAYFLLRYYQYWRQESKGEIKSSLIEQFDLYIKAYTGVQLHQDETTGAINDEYKLSQLGLFSWSYISQSYDLVTGGLKDNQGVRLSCIVLVGLWLKSVLYVVFQTPHTTDHILPFLMAVAVPVTALLKILSSLL